MSFMKFNIGLNAFEIPINRCNALDPVIVGPAWVAFSCEIFCVAMVTHGSVFLANWAHLFHAIKSINILILITAQPHK